MGSVYTKPRQSNMSENRKTNNETEQKTEIQLDGVPARVDKIHINGLSRTKDDFIQQSVKDLFQATDFQEVILKSHSIRAKLDQLGIFRNVGVYIDVSRGPKSTENGLEVTFYVRELKRLIGGVNTMVGNNEGALVIGAKMPNIFGRAEKIQTEYSYGSKKSNNFQIQFVKPLLGRYNTVLTSSLYQSLSEFPWSGYRQIDRGLLLDIAFDSLPNLGLRHNLQWDASVRDLGALSRATSFPVREHSGLTLKSSLKHIVSLDLRDEQIFPKVGTYVRLTTELAGFGGDVGFLKNELFGQINLPLIQDITLQAGVQIGAIHATSLDKKITLGDQFFLGGPLTLRGFQTSGVGPHSEGNSLGSDVYWGGALHLYTPLPFNPGKNGFGDLFRTHFFVNAGNVANIKSDDVENSLKELKNNIRLSYGLGLAIRLGQMARVEVNYCFPIQYQRGDQLNPGVQFGIGVNFL